MDHVTTQLPYALVCALASTIGYVLLGFTKNTTIRLLTALASLAVGVFLLKGKFSDRELDESRVESEVSAA